MEFGFSLTILLIVDFNVFAVYFFFFLLRREFNPLEQLIFVFDFDLLYLLYNCWLFQQLAVAEKDVDFVIFIYCYYFDFTWRGNSCAVASC